MHSGLENITIHGRRSFRRILERERDRADRSGHGFSLIACRLPGKNSTDRQRLAEELAGYLTVTDEMGWLDRRTVGLLLFNVPAARALGLRQRIVAAMAPRQGDSAPAVYTYPYAWQGEEDGVDRSEAAAAKSLEEGLDCPVGCVFHSFFINKQPRWKRAIDIVGALVLIVLCAPILLLVALAVKCTSRGPVIFTQPRAGLGGTPFLLYKFRSMCVDAECRKKELLAHNERTGPVFKMRNDPRVTPVGRIIRKWSLDELPQLFNVLQGHMSLVGPRPATLDETEKYERWHKGRLRIKPGITCIWQVYARHDKDFNTWVRLDLQYLRIRSLLTDIKLLLRTIPAVLSRRGAC